MFWQFYLHWETFTKAFHGVPTHGDFWDARVGPMGCEQSMIFSGNQIFLMARQTKSSQIFSFHILENQ